MKSKRPINRKRNKDHYSTSRKINDFEEDNIFKSEVNNEARNKNNKTSNNKKKSCKGKYKTIKNNLDNDKSKAKNIDENESKVNINYEENTDSDNSTNIPNRDELVSQLKTLNLSIDTLYIIILATLLNLYYLYSLRAQVSDQLFNTNESENFIDTKNFPRITNTMFLYSTGVFLNINYKGLEDAKRASAGSNDKSGLIRAWKSFLSSLLVFLATAISRDNLEL